VALVNEAALHEVHGDIGDVNADPPSAQPLGDGDGGPAAAEGVEDDVAFVAASEEDAFEQGLGLLGGIAQAFLRRLIDAIDISPEASDRDSASCRVKRFLSSSAREAAALARLGPMDEAVLVPLIHARVRIGPMPPHSGRVESAPRLAALALLCHSGACQLVGLILLSVGSSDERMG